MASLFLGRGGKEGKRKECGCFTPNSSGDEHLLILGYKFFIFLKA